MDHSEAGSSESTRTKIQIRCKYLDMDLDLNAGSELDQGKTRATRGIRSWIKSTPR